MLQKGTILGWFWWKNRCFRCSCFLSGWIYFENSFKRKNIGFQQMHFHWFWKFILKLVSIYFTNLFQIYENAFFVNFWNEQYRSFITLSSRTFMNVRIFERFKNIFFIFKRQKICYIVDFKNTSLVSFDAYFHKFILWILKTLI